MASLIADIAEGDRGRSDQGQQRRGNETAVDRRHRRFVAVFGVHREDTDD